MGLKVLKTREEIAQARNELRRRGLSFTSPRWLRLARRLRISRSINVGDELKSWDILKTVDFIESRVPKDAPILDLGAFASEMVYILHRIGYLNLSAVDLNPRIKEMAHADAVRYVVSDFMHTPFEADSFQAITAISVIEHGFDSEALLSEVARLLRPRGCFIASFDYCPEKVDTTGTSIFGMSWRIFSEQEVRAFFDEAIQHNLFPFGEIDFTGKDKPINFAHKDYTFAWFALRKGVRNL